METTQKVSGELNLEGAIPSQFPQAAQEKLKIQVIFKKLRGGFCFVIGYLLSPLCWWNDLIFNLPVAYFLGIYAVYLPQIYSCLVQLYGTGFLM